MSDKESRMHPEPVYPKHTPKLGKRGGWGEGEAQPTPSHLQTQCSHHGLPSFTCFRNNGMMGFNLSHALKKACTAKKTGGVGGRSQHNARMMAFKQKLALLKKAEGSEKHLNGLKKRGGLGGGALQTPPFANTMLA